MAATNRYKYTTDRAWTVRHGSSEVDIASSSFEDLPEDWQAENRAAAQAALALLEAGLESGADVRSNSFIECAASQVHIAWLGRNVWAQSGRLAVPYEQL